MTSLGEMPVISVFFGIVIRMYYEDHDPAHFHAEYQGQRAKFSFDGKLIAGSIRSATARRRIAEWGNIASGSPGSQLAEHESGPSPRPNRAAKLRWR